MKNIIKTLILLLISGTISGCNGSHVDRSFIQLDYLKPMHFVFNHMPEDAPDLYKEGWKAGCESGLSAFGNEFYKTFYHFQSRPDLAHRSMYQRAWETAYHYCRGYGYGMIKEAEMRQTRPQEHPIKLTGLDQWIQNWGPQMFKNWWMDD